MRALSRSTIIHWAANQLAVLPLRLTPEDPVFIIGCARSGTSVLRRVLGRHPAIDAYPSEANELWHPSSYPWSTSARRTGPLWLDPVGFTQDSLATWPDNHRARIKRVFSLHQRLSSRPVFLNKSSMINFMLPEVDRMFPGARYVHIVRDGRAVALSYALKEHRKMVKNEELYRASGAWMDFAGVCRRMACLWIETLSEIALQRDALGWACSSRYYECRYEDFCANPLESARGIVGFLGRDAAATQVGEPIRSMNHKFREQLAPSVMDSITDTMAASLEAKGYPRNTP